VEKKRKRKIEKKIEEEGRKKKEAENTVTAVDA
jgi:hypothetical protein